MMLLFILPLLVASAAAARDARCMQYKAGSEAMTLPHNSDCTKFYICDIAGSALQMDCPQFTYFSAVEGVCSFDRSGCTEAGSNNIPWNKDVIVSDGSGQHNSIDSACRDLPSGTTLPLVGDCNSYIVCFQNKAIPLMCPEGLAYDSRNSKCEFKQAVNCNVASPLLPAKPINLISTPELVEDHSSQNTWNVQMPINPLPEAPLNPSQPILPMPQVPIVPPQVPSLPELMPYSPIQNGEMRHDARCLMRADPYNPIMLPHARDCSKYIVCVGSTTIEKECPNGQHWSVADSYCDFESRANCRMQ